MKVEDAEDLDENGQAKVSRQPAYVCKNCASMSICLFVVHKGTVTDARRNELSV